MKLPSSACGGRPGWGRTRALPITKLPPPIPPPAPSAREGILVSVILPPYERHPIPAPHPQREPCHRHGRPVGELVSAEFFRGEVHARSRLSRDSGESLV